MLAGQTMVAQDGYEVALFPMPYLRISQDEGGSYSHAGTYNMDLIGWNANGRVYQAPLYAPCTMKVVAYWNTYAGGHQVTYQSVNKVHLANGSLDYLTIAFAHDESPPYTQIGSVVRQGQLCYNTGTYGNVTGDHTHSCCGKGTYRGYTTRSTGHMDLTNRIHYYDAVYVNDTVISAGAGHNWKTYGGVIPPQPPQPPSGYERKGKFPWVLYSRKLRKSKL